MKRSSFKVQRPPGMRPPRAAKQIGPEYTPRPRSVASPSPREWFAATAPKTRYVRDERFQAMCRGTACKRCGADGESSGVTWAHSNQAIHGKGGAIKASDEFVAALCWRCHALLDQGSAWSEAEKVAIWTAAYRLTVALAVQIGTWPTGFPVPVFEDEPDEVTA